LIALGYALSVGGGFAAVTLNEARIPQEVSQNSGGMVAFGDMVVFVLATGFLSLAPSWFLLKLLLEKAPRVLLAIELLIAAIGPPSWLAVAHLTDGPGVRSPPQASEQLFGLFLALFAIPRMVLGPVLLVIEVATFILVRGRIARTLLVAAMLMDLVPLSLFAAHMVGAVHR
jgi:hypothetical protein